MDRSLMTITCKAGIVQAIKLNSNYNTINIYNNTDNDLLISRTTDFVDEDNIGYYLTIPANTAYNSLFLSNRKTIYIKSQVDGIVTIAVRGW